MKLNEILSIEDRQKRLELALKSVDQKYGKESQQKRQKAELTKRKQKLHYKEASDDIKKYLNLKHISLDDYKNTDHYSMIIKRYEKSLIDRIIDDMAYKASLPKHNIERKPDERIVRQEKLNQFFKKYNDKISIEEIKSTYAKKVVNVTMPRNISEKIPREMLIDIADRSAYHFGGALKDRKIDGNNITYTIHVYTD